MKYFKRKYETPVRPWDKQRIETEREILKSYGLKNKRELWRAEGLIRKYRRLVRELVAKHDEERGKTILNKLVELGVLDQGAGLDDILALSVQKFLERRLETILQRRGIANTVKQARQMIVHGHVRIGDRKVVYPSYIVSRANENKIRVMAKQTKVKKFEGKAEKTGAGGNEEGREAAAAT